YDSRIMFNGQPIALVVAETSEIARFAASLVRVEYEKETHITDVYRRREAATPVQPPTNPLEALFTPPKTRGRPEQALLAAPRRRILRSDRASQPNGALCRYRGLRGQRQANGLRQDARRAERSALSLRRVQHEARGCSCHEPIHGRWVRLGPAPAV